MPNTLAPTCESNETLLSLDQIFRVFDSEGNYPPSKFAENPAKYDLLLISSLTNNNHRNTPLSLQRLAETSHQSGNKTAILVSRDSTPLDERLESCTDHLTALSNNILKKFTNIGFSVFDGDIVYLIEFLRLIEAGEIALPNLHKIIIGGVGINDNANFFVNELTIHLQNLNISETSPLKNISIIIARGEGENLMPEILAGNTEHPSVFTLFENGEIKTNGNTSIPFNKIPSTGPDNTISLPKLAENGRWLFPGNLRPIIVKLREKMNTILQIATPDKLDSAHRTIQAIFSNMESLGILSTEISRDCPHPCNFCSLRSTSEGKVRRISTDHAIEQFDEYLKTGRHEFRLTDDDLFFSTKWWREFIKKTGGKELSKYLSFGGFAQPVTIKTFKQEDLEGMAKSGLSEVHFGLQSVDKDELKFMNRKVTSPELILEVLPILKKLGISVKIDFISGYPLSHRNVQIYTQRRLFRERVKEIMGDDIEYNTGPFIFAPGSPREIMVNQIASEGLDPLDIGRLASNFEPSPLLPFSRNRFGNFGEILLAIDENGLTYIRSIKLFKEENGLFTAEQTPDISEGLEKIINAVNSHTPSEQYKLVHEIFVFKLQLIKAIHLINNIKKTT